MPTIMCTRDLWRSLGKKGVLGARPSPEEETTRLGAWAAKVTALPEGRFCVALNEATYLTAIFPFLPLPMFIELFVAAVILELEHIGTPSDVIKAEMEPVFENITFARNSNRSLLGSLNDVCLHFEWAMEADGRTDPEHLLWIQHKLNVMPHVKREPPFPVEAVSLLLSGQPRAQ